MGEAVPRLDERASDWLDERMDATERRRFEAELEGDPTLARELEGLEAVVTTLRGLPVEEAPSDFLDAVKSRIRRRSRGRYFSFRFKYRFPYEAVVNGILIGLLMAVYIISMPMGDELVVAVGPEASRQGVAGPSAAAALLTRFGAVEVEHASADGREVVYRAVVRGELVPALVEEMTLYPDLVLLDVTPPPGEVAADGDRVVRVQATARAWP